jgi:hypothetical protein
MTRVNFSRALVPPDLSWLIGRVLLGVQRKDFTWCFNLDDGGHIDTESQWRLIKESVVMTSEDDGHSFGLPSPVNAAATVEKIVAGSFVNRFELDNRTGDLSLCFQNGVTIQFVTLSSGYEGWRIGHGDREIVCLGGGELAIPSRG